MHRHVYGHAHRHESWLVHGHGKQARGVRCSMSAIRARLVVASSVHSEHELRSALADAAQPSGPSGAMRMLAASCSAVRDAEAALAWACQRREALQAAISAADVDMLDAALEGSRPVLAAQPLSEVEASAMRLVERIRALLARMDAYTEVRDEDGLRRSLEECSSLGVPEAHAVVGRARERLQWIGMARAALRDASEQADAALLGHAMAMVDAARPIAVAQPLAREYDAAAAKYEAVVQMASELQHALDANDATALRALEQSALAMGVPPDAPLLAGARAGLADITALEASLSSAVTAGDVDEIRRALCACRACPADQALGIAAASAGEMLRRHESAARRLEAATIERDEGALGEALGLADALGGGGGGLATQADAARATLATVAAQRASLVTACERLDAGAIRSALAELDRAPPCASSSMLAVEAARASKLLHDLDDLLARLADASSSADEPALAELLTAPLLRPPSPLASSPVVVAAAERLSSVKRLRGAFRSAAASLDEAEVAAAIGEYDSWSAVAERQPITRECEQLRAVARYCDGARRRLRDATVAMDPSGIERSVECSIGCLSNVPWNNRWNAPSKAPSNV